MNDFNGDLEVNNEFIDTYELDCLQDKYL